MAFEKQSVQAPLAQLPAPAGYGDFLRDVKAQIRQRQYQALRAANCELLALYWWLGEGIGRRQAELGWGQGVVEALARDLQSEFPGRNGFSAQNLWLMRQRYNEYRDKPNLQSLIGEVSWSKNLLVMARCKDDLEREFYLRATARFGWTSKVLQHQIDNQSYQQYLNGQTNFDAALPDTVKAQALLAAPGPNRDQPLSVRDDPPVLRWQWPYWPAADNALSGEYRCAEQACAVSVGLLRAQPCQLLRRVDGGSGVG